MTSESPEMAFEESTEIPTGRKARSIAQHLWNHLEDSAKRGVAKVSPAMSHEEVAKLRKDLTSAAVQAKYDVTTETQKLDNGLAKLKFAAKRKPKPKAESATK